MDPLAKKELCEALVAGGACVAGISLAQINVWLSTASLTLSVIAALLAIFTHARRYWRRDTE